MIKRNLAFAAALIALAANTNAQFLFRKQARVLTDAWASPTFLERRNTPDGLAPMTYHFYQGNFHGGAISDKSLQSLSLQEIADTLAADMTQQNFHPAESPQEGDLIVVVHWGVTEVKEKWDELFPDTGDDSEGETDEDGVPIDTSPESSDLATTRRPSVAKNAQLTGIQKALRKKGLTPSDRQDLRALLEEERYFIILMAYDWQLMQKENKPELQWSCRFSLPSPGTNFIDAVPALSRAAGPLIGTNIEDLAKTKTQLGWGKGSVGELEVVEEIDEEELKEILKKPN